jgi:hypothetical protein
LRWREEREVRALMVVGTEVLEVVRSEKQGFQGGDAGEEVVWEAGEVVDEVDAEGLQGGELGDAAGEGFESCALKGKVLKIGEVMELRQGRDP